MAEKFKPTQEQADTRRSARSLYDNGMYLVGEWVKRIPKLTLFKWQSWERTDGFFDWWAELLPEHGGVTLSDLRALEFEANRSLMTAMMEGDLGATKIVIQMVSNVKESKEIADKSLDDWFAASDTEKNGWTKEWN
tara:strand:- start:315 stop:722 length:408 start_codon:yes stop_codon:yes gene_type:complete